MRILLGVALVAAVPALPTPAVAHGGGLNAEGCPRDGDGIGCE